MTNWGYRFDEPYKAISEGRFEDVPDRASGASRTGTRMRPTEPYSASKVWREGMCRAYADGHGLSCLCLRIGGVNDRDLPEGRTAVRCGFPAARPRRRSGSNISAGAPADRRAQQSVSRARVTDYQQLIYDHAGRRGNPFPGSAVVSGLTRRLV